MKLESLGYTQPPGWQRDDHGTSLTALVCFLPSRVREINQISVSVMIMASHDHKKQNDQGKMVNVPHGV